MKFVDETLGLVLHISIKIKDGWAVLPKPWVVEHSFAWLGRFRRQSQGFRDPDWDCREYDPYRHAQENACKLRLNFCQIDSYLFLLPKWVSFFFLLFLLVGVLFLLLFLLRCPFSSSFLVSFFFFFFFFFLMSFFFFLSATAPRCAGSSPRHSRTTSSASRRSATSWPNRKNPAATRASPKAAGIYANEDQRRPAAYLGSDSMDRGIDPSRSNMRGSRPGRI